MDPGFYHYKYITLNVTISMVLDVGTLGLLFLLDRLPQMGLFHQKVCVCVCVCVCLRMCVYLIYRYCQIFLKDCSSLCCRLLYVKILLVSTKLRIIILVMIYNPLCVSPFSLYYVSFRCTAS